MSHMAGLFYEDEAEITSITEDMYASRKKAGTVLSLGSGSSAADEEGKEGAIKVDSSLLELIKQQFGSFTSHHSSSLAKASDAYLRAVNRRFAKQTSRVEQMDNNYVIYITLEQVKNQVRRCQEFQANFSPLSRKLRLTNSILERKFETQGVHMLV